MGTHDRAYTAYDVALKMDNDIVDAHKKRGLYRMELKQWALAEKDFTEMLRINPRAFFAYRALGLCDYYTGNYPAAVDHFTKFLANDDLNKEVRSFRGMAYQKNTQVLDATLDFLIADAHGGIDAFPVLQAELEKFLVAKDTATVIDWLKKFTDAEPSYIAAQRYLLNFLMGMGKWDDVGQQVDRALFRTPDTKSKSMGPGYTKKDKSYLIAVKGTSLVHQDRADEAIRELNTAIEWDKNNSLAYLSRGKAQLKRKNRSAAVKDFKKAEELGDKEASIVLKSL
jgi:tetratricopeptide (TPR) repeat protein